MLGTYYKSSSLLRQLVRSLASTAASVRCEPVPCLVNETAGQVDIDRKTGFLKLFWNNAKSDCTQYHPRWLRFNCQCAECRQPSSNQRIMDCSRIGKNVKLDSVSVDTQGQTLNLRWLEDDHAGTISLKWLQQTTDYGERDPVAFQGAVLHRFDGSLPDDTIGLPLLQTLANDGFALVHNLPATAGTVKTFVESVLHLPVQKTIYGEIFDVVSMPNPINVAYSDEELKLHMDLVYYESPPGLQLLHCLRFDERVRGGESTFVDGFLVAEELRHRHPEKFRILSSMPATFEKIHFDRAWPVHMRYRRPHIALNENEDVTGIFWSPQFEGPLVAPLHEMDAYYDAYQTFTDLIETSPNKFEFRLMPGEMVIFNNRRLLHGRKGFSGDEGIRHFQGCYVNIDEFASQAKIGRIRHGLSPNIPRVANRSC